MYKIVYLFLLFCLGWKLAQSQYYYNDILSNKQARENYLLLKKYNIKKVAASSTNPDNSPVEDFAILQQVNLTKKEIITSTKSPMTPTSILYSSYLDNGSPFVTRDSTEAAVSITNYAYTSDSVPQLYAITSTTHEPEKAVTKFSEKRIYTFENKQLKSMWRIKNNQDSLQVLFFPEEHGWIGEERWMQKGKPIESYYYYYDSTGRLTDIARYNTTAKRPLPDYTFEYNGIGRLITMHAFVEGTNQYRIWRYNYDGRGLKIRETIYNKYQQVEGKISYYYDLP